MQRSIAYLSTSRADYGLMRWVLQDLADAPDIRLLIVAAGTHFSEAYGSTIREIREDGFELACQIVSEGVELGTPESTAAWLAQLLEELTNFLRSEKPDLLLLAGDRIELLTAGIAALLTGTEIAHAYGGEITEGSIDDPVRHSLSQMATIHFAAADSYASHIRRIVRNPRNIHSVGAPALCALERGTIPTLEELQEFLEYDLTAPFISVTIHPVTRDRIETLAVVSSIVEVSESDENLRAVITGSNADIQGEQVSAAMRALARRHPERIQFVSSLGHARYLALLTHAIACVGNSSSGLIEAPAVGTPTINIGSRQRGRLLAQSVVSVAPQADALRGALDTIRYRGRKAFYDPDPPYGGPGASRRISAVLIGGAYQRDRASTVGWREPLESD